MNHQTCTAAGTPKACLEKATELFFVTHPKAYRDVLGPFLNKADAECGRVVLRSTDAVVEVRPVAVIDEMTRWHAENNGRVCRVFAGRQEESHD